MYRGEAVTILREAQAYGVWFLSFEYMMNADARRNGTKRDEISQLKVPVNNSDERDDFSYSLF